jgi:hypothetical protein
MTARELSMSVSGKDRGSARNEVEGDGEMERYVRIYLDCIQRRMVSQICGWRGGGEAEWRV